MGAQGVREKFLGVGGWLIGGRMGRRQDGGFPCGGGARDAGPYLVVATERDRGDPLGERALPFLRLGGTPRLPVPTLRTGM